MGQLPAPEVFLELPASVQASSRSEQGESRDLRCPDRQPSSAAPGFRGPRAIGSSAGFFPVRDTYWPHPRFNILWLLENQLLYIAFFA